MVGGGGGGGEEEGEGGNKIGHILFIIASDSSRGRSAC